MKSYLITIGFAILILIFAMPINYLGILPFFLAPSVAMGMLNNETFQIPIILVYGFCIIYTLIYLGYFGVFHFIYQKFIKQHNYFILKTKLYYVISLIIPITISCFTIILYDENSFISKAYYDHKETLEINEIISYEDMVNSYEVLGNFGMNDIPNLSADFYISPNKDSIITKVHTDAYYQYKTYYKYSEKDIFYLINYTNYTYKEYPAMNTDHLDFVNMSSSSYLKYNDIELVTISVPMKTYLNLFDFIKIGDDYYLSDFGVSTNSDWDKKYVNMVQNIWTNRAVFSDGFFQYHDGQKLDFTLLQHPDLITIDGDFFSVNNTPFIRLDK